VISCPPDPLTARRCARLPVHRDPSARRARRGGSRQGGGVSRLSGVGAPGDALPGRSGQRFRPGISGTQSRPRSSGARAAIGGPGLGEIIALWSGVVKALGK